MSLEASKKEVRGRVRAVLRAMSNEYLQEQSMLACERLFASKEWKDARGIACFASMAKEFQTQILLNRVVAEKKELFLPRVISKRDMVLLRVPPDTTIEDLPRNHWNIPEPELKAEGDALHTDELDIVLVPGLAFSAETKARLGQGAGYYDTWLAKLAEIRTQRKLPMPLTIGLCLDEQLLRTDEIPLEPHDFIINHLVAPSFSSLSSSSYSMRVSE